MNLPDKTLLDYNYKLHELEKELDEVEKEILNSKDEGIEEKEKKKEKLEKQIRDLVDVIWELKKKNNKKMQEIKSNIDKIEVPREKIAQINIAKNIKDDPECYDSANVFDMETFKESCRKTFDNILTKACNSETVPWARENLADLLKKWVNRIKQLKEMPDDCEVSKMNSINRDDNLPEGFMYDLMKDISNGAVQIDPNQAKAIGVINKIDGNKLENISSEDRKKHVDNPIFITNYGPFLVDWWLEFYGPSSKEEIDDGWYNKAINDLESRGMPDGSIKKKEITEGQDDVPKSEQGEKKEKIEAEEPKPKETN